MLIARVLAIILAVWEPLNLALLLGPILTTIGTRGFATAAFLLARIVITGVGVAAGIALWTNAPHARGLALFALFLSTLAAIATFTTTLLPTHIVPGDRWFSVLAVVVFNGFLAAAVTRVNDDR